jgi:hypothetical protein
MTVQDPDTFYLNGTAYSWASVLLYVDGIPRRRFTGVKFSEKMERVKTAGAKRSGKPFAMSFGQYKLESLSITMLPEENLWLRQYLAAKGGGNSVSRASFTLTIQLSEDGNAITATFDTCKYGGMDQGMKEGAEITEVEVPLDALSMDLNGTTTYDELRDVR